MRPVKTRPRFKCDYCSRVSTEKAMIAHEKICWRNKDRYCVCCDNQGYIEEDYGVGVMHRIECPYCSAFNPDRAGETHSEELEAALRAAGKI